MLQVHRLSVQFRSPRDPEKSICAVRSLDLRIEAGELVAVIGQSGAGKSLLAHAILGLLPSNATLSGTILFHGRNLTPDEIRRLRGRHMTLIPQSVSALNPLRRVGDQLARAARRNGHPSPRHAVFDALERFSLAPTVAKRFPFQLSGGMARRVLTALATMGGAELILADEPTNGLDPETAHESLAILRQLADQNRAVMVITHDIEAVLPVADRLVVFCAGMTLEDSPAAVFATGAPHHPYSQALLAALPSRDFRAASTLSADPTGCFLTDSCPHAFDSCHHEIPPLRPMGAGWVRCWRHA